jgi:predicted Zn-dependent protease
MPKNFSVKIFKNIVLNTVLGFLLFIGIPVIMLGQVTTKPTPKPTPSPKNDTQLPILTDDDKLLEPPPTPKPTPKPVLEGNTTPTIPDPKSQIGKVPREKREQAYIKLLEGQRYIWQMERLRGQRSATEMMNSGRLAKLALQKAIEFDPTLAEAYTALAELTWQMSSGETSEAVRLANIAISLNPNNYGGHYLLAQIYTLRSQVNVGNPDAEAAEKAIAAWREIARLDPRSAEAWAFLSLFYEKTNREKENLEALEKWRSAAAPLQSGFYKYVTNGDLSPEAASLKLGAALIKAGRAREAVIILSNAIAEDPDNEQALDLLNQAIDFSGNLEAQQAIEALEQAVYANPENYPLIEMLARTQARAGKVDDAIKTLKSAIEKTSEKDKPVAAALSITLAEIYADVLRDREAVDAFEQALTLRGIGEEPLESEVDREIATTIFTKIVGLHKNAGRTLEANEAVERLRRLLGKDDITPDQQLIELLVAQGKRQEALTVVRNARQRFPGEDSLLRTEANILTELGKVDEGVNLIKTRIVNKNGQITVPQAIISDFLNYLTISSLYVTAKRGEDAIQAAQDALKLSQADELQRIGMLTLATAQDAAADYKGSEETLRKVLKRYPNDPTALNNLGYFLVERNEKLPEAIELIKKAVRLEPTNASFLDSLGWAYFKTGQLEEAEKYLYDAARRSTSSSTIWEHLGDVYHKQNKLDQAKTAWEKALKNATHIDDVTRIKGKLTDKKTSKK